MTSISDEDSDFLNRGILLPILESFYSIQGEGFNTGKAAYFIRIGGCDVGCRWCDAKESWNPDLQRMTKTDLIIEEINQSKATAVVVTGGEPLNYNLNYLCAQLKKNGIQTFIETSGSQKMSGFWDWVCLSPKKQNPPLPINYKQASELKIIIFEESDFIWAEECANKVGDAVYKFLQPEWSKKKQMMPIIVDYILQHPQWMISLQSHKYMNIP